MAFALTITRLFAPTQLTASAATIYAAPANPASSVLQGGRVRFTNTDTSVHTVTAYAVPSGGTASAANCFMNAESLSPNTHLDIDVPQLAAGDFFQAFANTAAMVTVTALGGTVQSQ